MKKQELINQLIEHDRKAQEYDKRLRVLCEAGIHTMMYKGDFEEAKKYVKEFYRDIPGDVVCIERDFLIASINKKIKEQ